MSSDLHHSGLRNYRGIPLFGPLRFTQCASSRFEDVLCLAADSVDRCDRIGAVFAESEVCK